MTTIHIKSYFTKTILFTTLIAGSISSQGCSELLAQEELVAAAATRVSQVEGEVVAINAAAREAAEASGLELPAVDFSDRAAMAIDRLSVARAEQIRALEGLVETSGRIRDYAAIGGAVGGGVALGATGKIAYDYGYNKGYLTAQEKAQLQLQLCSEATTKWDKALKDGESNAEALGQRAQQLCKPQE